MFGENFKPLHQHRILFRGYFQRLFYGTWPVEGTVAPVSYTHLDVYKRQYMIQAVVNINLPIAMPIIIQLLAMGVGRKKIPAEETKTEK